MDDDFNTGGAVGVLFEMRRCINAFIDQRKLDSGGSAAPEDIKALKSAMTLFKELSNLLGVFRRPPEKVGGDGADDEFVGSLMDLIIEIRGTARKSKNFEIADLIRDGLSARNVTLEDRPDGTLWRRG
jgi:cysteinyl-tRNA synthetase